MKENMSSSGTRPRRFPERAATAAWFTGSILAMALSARALACEGWTKVFESASEQVHFAAALSGGGTEWTVGGIGIVVTGSGTQSMERPLPGLTMERFAIGLDGNTFAVGSHGTIWRRTSKAEWQIEHQTRPAGTKGKKPNEDLLVAVRVVPYQGKRVLLAHGPVGTPSLVRDEQGKWAAIADPALGRELINLSLFGPKLDVPRNCNVDSWRWLSEQDGIALCRDGRVFVLADGKLSAAGKAPKACELMWNVVRRRGELYTSCGDAGRITKYAAGKWSTLQAPAGVFALAANDQCLVAATKRTVWQHCL